MSDLKITVYFCTNRNQTDGDEYFGSNMGNHPALFRVGRAVVDVKVFRHVRWGFRGEHNNSRR